MSDQSLKMMLTFLIPGLALLLVVCLILFRWGTGGSPDACVTHTDLRCRTYDPSFPVCSICSQRQPQAAAPVSTYSQPLIPLVVPSCVLTHSASHKLRLKDSITSRLAPTANRQPSYRPSPAGGATDSNIHANGHNGMNAFTAGEKYFEPITNASGMVTNADEACCDEQQLGQDGGAAAASGPEPGANTHAPGARPNAYELTEGGEDIAFNWHWKSLVSDIFIWAALFTLLAGVAMPEAR